ncbi:MAG: hypothetical protein JKY81_04965 [Colwellia sp.]|nr:hypothetical protein [Colwellia sp.]
MKIITLTLHIDVEEAQTIISFIDELKTVLVANYGEEIQENHRANTVITDGQSRYLEGKMNNII